MLVFLSRRGVFWSLVMAALIILIGTTAFTYLHVNDCVAGSITVNGSTALAPLVQDVANDYHQKCPIAAIAVNPVTLPTGSFKGLAQVEQGKVDIGLSDVFADPSQNAGLEDHQVAVVVFALVVNQDVRNADITGLTTQQVRRIYSGDVTNWNEVGGNSNLDIVRVSRPDTSGTRAVFERYILNGIETISGPQSLVNDTTETVAKYVKMQAGAIGYVSLYYAKKYGLTILQIDGKDPTSSTLVKDGSYNFWSLEHMYTKGSAQGLAKAFIDYIYSDEARSIVRQDDYLNITDMNQNVLTSHVF